MSETSEQNSAASASPVDRSVRHSQCLEMLIDEGVLEHVAYMFKVQDETGATPELREFAAIDFHEAPGQTVLSKQPLFMVPNAEVSGPPQRTEPQETRHE